MLAFITSLFAALAPFFAALAQALVIQAVQPATATVLNGTPDQAAAATRAAGTLRTFPGIKLGLVLLACLLGAGCFGQRVVIAGPLVPVRLAKPIVGADVFVQAPDGTWQEATCDLPAGQVVTYDPDLWTIAEVAGVQHFVPKVTTAPPATVPP